MVKQIVALSIALLLMLGSALYGISLPSNDSTVNFGAGDGVSKAVETPEELKSLLENIPEMSDYLENQDITAVVPGFVPFTMTETGSSEELNGATKTERSHTLKICFTAKAVYYSCIGSMVTTTYDAANDYANDERTTLIYDMELYYSKELVLVKYNDYSIALEEYQNGSWTAASDTEAAMAEKTVEAMSSSFGSWMKAEKLTEEEIMVRLEGLTGDQMAIEYSVHELCSTISETYTNDVTSSTDANIRYLISLSDFLSDNLNSSFFRDGNNYELKQETETVAAYLAALGAPAGSYKDTSSARVSFELGSDGAEVDQSVSLYMSDRKTASFSSSTTFTDIGNTVVSLKDTEIKSVYELLGDEFRALIEELMTEGVE